MRASFVFVSGGTSSGAVATFARAFVIGFAWAVNVRWRGAAGPQ